MSAGTRRAVRPLAGAAILATVLAVVGADDVLGSLRTLDAGSVVAAALIGVATTTCAAWRWRVVAGRLGVHLSLSAAVSGCYRAQFLNATLPGGVLGDVQRGVGHGRTVGRLGAALRAVAWERTCGFVILATIAVPVMGLEVVRTPWDGRAAGTAALAALVGVAALAAARPVRSGARRLVPGAAGDVRALATPGAAAAVLVTSALVIAGHVATFGVAARAAGVPLGGAALVAVALPVLLLGALPVNVAGWGPREGAAAWAFAEVGLGASRGLAVAVVYGVIALAATLPGAVLLALAALRGGTGDG